MKRLSGNDSTILIYLTETNFNKKEEKNIQTHIYIYRTLKLRRRDKQVNKTEWKGNKETKEGRKEGRKEERKEGSKLDENKEENKNTKDGKKYN